MQEEDAQKDQQGDPQEDAHEDAGEPASDSSSDFQDYEGDSDSDVLVSPDPGPLPKVRRSWHLDCTRLLGERSHLYPSAALVH